MSTSNKAIRVVAAVIENAAGEILIAKRPQHLHQGGLWEFPGGKVEENESTTAALQRELLEELNISYSNSAPLIQIHHDYPDKSVYLDVRRITHFSGTAIGNEGQPIKWVKKADLQKFKFPAANISIINAIQLPQKYLITPEHLVSERTTFLDKLESLLMNGISLVQLRAKNLSFDEYRFLFNQVNKLTEQYNAFLQVNTSVENAIKLGASGIHLTSSTLMKAKSLPEVLLTSASCHNQREIERACELGVQFILVSPVNATRSHPNSIPLGWQAFEKLCRYSRVPTYALGGMSSDDCITSIAHGGQGIAAISGLWTA